MLPGEQLQQEARKAIADLTVEEGYELARLLRSTGQKTEASYVSAAVSERQMARAPRRSVDARAWFYSRSFGS